MDVLLPALGVLIIFGVLQDVFSTVLYPASGRGLIRKPLARATWAVLGALGRAVGVERRRNLFSYGGPIEVGSTMTIWFLLLAVGWASIYAPALGRSVVASSGPTDTSWTTALYYSGFTLTTLGTGDVVATTGGYRLLSVVEAGVGLMTFTMVVTYFLSVYSNLPTRNAFAQELHERTRGTGDAAVLLASVVRSGDAATSRFLSSTAASLRKIYQTHRSYPVLRSFRYRDPEYALPRILLIALDAATLIRTLLGSERHTRLISSAALAELVQSAERLLDELAPRAPRVRPADEGDRDRWRRHAAAALDRLAALGVAADRAEAVARYARLRAGWDPRLRALAAAMHHEWDEIDPRCRP